VAPFPAGVPTEPTLQNVGALLGITQPSKASNRDVA
jgi:hypothetical protein